LEFSAFTTKAVAWPLAQVSGDGCHSPLVVFQKEYNSHYNETGVVFFFKYICKSLKAYAATLENFSKKCGQR